ncbi:hypothetical protein PENCOP_c011G05020 [Penicillium coprophilum]|uniref:Uncharacterized protein n=1 Tax=Penicillium coprophilum TaxID=36646 RepID=A0A1V6UE58_9EURO|nr:hypothetical protein PENCOP_c011G05020 [Penicillium coprophilum]
MGRPRRAAAQKPAGHYALTSATRVQKVSATPVRKQRKKKSQSEEDAMSLDTAVAGPSRKSRKKKDHSEEDAMSLDTVPAGPSGRQHKGKGRSEGDTMGTDMPPQPKKDRKGKGRSEDNPAPVGADTQASAPVYDPSPEPLDPAALALDLKNSYEGKLPLPAPRPERQTRWRQPATNPIERFEDTPKGWNHDEPDLDPNDLESQITRCHERISDNIMIHQFQFKLQELLRKQTYRNEMMALEPPGLSWPVVQRLKSLRGMLEWLGSKGDEYESAANVAGLIEAYQSGKLKCNAGLVTYWSHGVQLCEPRPFRWDECDLLSAEHDGQKGFWVEGLHGPGVNQQRLQWLTHEDLTVAARFTGNMNMCLKLHDLPGRLSRCTELSFIDDTGASIMQINRSDLMQLLSMNVDNQGNLPPNPTILGVSNLSFANGHASFFTCVRLEVNMWDPVTNTWLSPIWHPVPVVLYDDIFGPPELRLNGPWPRHRMYTASAPGQDCQTYFSDQHPTNMNVPTASVLDMNKSYPNPPLLSTPDWWVL